MAGSSETIYQEAMPLDIINRSRKYMLQHNVIFENSLGVRLSYARWLLIFGLFGFFFLDHILRGKQLVFSTNTVYLIGAYAVFNLLVWLLSLTIGKQSKLLLIATLVLDVFLSVFISYTMESLIYSFAFMPAFLAVVMIGVPQGVLAFTLVAVANLYELLNTDFTTLKIKDEIFVNFYGISGALILTILAFYVLTQSGNPLIRVSAQMVEEALARANANNLLEMQNRTRALYRVANTLSSTLDYEQVIKTILHEMETVFEVSAGAVLLFEGSLSTMRVVDALRLAPEEENRSVSLQAGVFKQIMNRGEPLLLTKGEELVEALSIFPSLRNCQSVMLIPLRAGMEVFGLMLIASKHENAYSTNDIELVIGMSAHTVLAMQNATLYHNLLEDRNKLLTQEEEVRHELARNLHDGPAQAVAAISMQTEFIRRLFKTEPDRALDELTNLGKQAQQTSREIRTLLYELRPLVLESQGLVPAMEQYAKRFPHNPSDPQVHVSTANFPARLSPQVETTIFTILQEAVNNARKHARSRNIWLHMEVRDGYILASAQDDGRGFDVAAMESNYDQRGSLGMTNMKERAALVGGQVNVRSVVGQGTAIVIRIPVNDQTVPANTSPSTDY